MCGGGSWFPGKLEWGGRKNALKYSLALKGIGAGLGLM